MRVGADENCGLLLLTFARISRPMPVYLLEARCTCSGERTMNRRFGKAWIGTALAVFLPAGLRRGGRRQISP